MSDGHVHVCRGVNVRFRAYVKMRGQRNWTGKGDWHRDERRAYNAMTEAMKSRTWKRGAVWMIADYYDPISVMEMVRP